MTEVQLYVGSEPVEYHLNIYDVDGAGVFVARSSDVIIDRTDWVEPVPFRLDLRVFKPPLRVEKAKELATRNTEPVQRGVMLELGTVHALLGEIETRIPCTKDTLIIPPSTAVIFDRRGRGGGQRVPHSRARCMSQAHP